MRVTQVERATELESNHIYVIAPNSQLVLKDHTISAEAFDEPRYQRAPIDFFFRSLAEQHIDGSAYAVVLTGAGADGALGVRAIKEAGGIVLVQDPNEAEFASMPRSAIAAEVADFVLPVRGLADQLALLLSDEDHAQPRSAGDDEETLRRILAHLRVRIGHDFSLYKKATILRRIARRAQVTRSASLADYFAYLRDNVDEAQALFADFLISVTSFFRDPEVFDVLARDAIPQLFDGKDAGGSIRVWVPGCATGEEAYTIGILLLEQAARREMRTEIQVFGSDLDAAALAVGREGRYPATIEADVSEDRLRRFFQREGDHYRVRRELRDIVMFANHSLLRDPPFSRQDMISCRNLLIYLDRELQQQVCNTFHYALNPGGFLLLGTSESADQPPGLFRQIDRESRIYRSVPNNSSRKPALPLLLGPRQVTMPGPSVTRSPAVSAGSDATLHRQMLEAVAPPSMLVDEGYRAIHLSDTAGRFLHHSGGTVSTDATDIVREELRFDLRTALHRAFERGEASLSMPLAVQFNGSKRRVYLQVKPVQQGGDPIRYALVFFIEGDAIEDGAAESPAASVDGVGSETIRQLQEQLQVAQDRLRATREESEATNEELRAANEELQSINEEYRSTSEELETSKEELQSINEELQTVNNELKLKLESVSRAHSDLQNLMAATDFGTLFLDLGLRIKRFTPRLMELFNVTANDEGRPITDFTHQLDYDALADHARLVLKDLVPVQHEVQSRTGAWYLVRIRPYRTLDEKIDGVVATFVDITERRRAEEALRESEARLRQEMRLVELSRSPIFVWDFDDGIHPVEPRLGAALRIHAPGSDRTEEGPDAPDPGARIHVRAHARFAARTRHVERRAPAPDEGRARAHGGKPDRIGHRRGAPPGAGEHARRHRTEAVGAAQAAPAQRAEPSREQHLGRRAVDRPPDAPDLGVQRGFRRALRGAARRALAVACPARLDQLAERRTGPAHPQPAVGLHGKGCAAAAPRRPSGRAAAPAGHAVRTGAARAGDERGEVRRVFHRGRLRDPHLDVRRGKPAAPRRLAGVGRPAGEKALQDRIRRNAHRTQPARCARESGFRRDRTRLHDRARGAAAGGRDREMRPRSASDRRRVAAARGAFPSSRAGRRCSSAGRREAGRTIRQPPD